MSTSFALTSLEAWGSRLAAARGPSSAIRAQTRPGVTTGELDEIGARIFAKAGARSGPQLDYGFPGTSCISVNDKAVHGVPRQQTPEGR